MVAGACLPLGCQKAEKDTKKSPCTNFISQSILTFFHWNCHHHQLCPSRVKHVWEARFLWAVLVACVIGIPNVPQAPPNPYILITLQKVNKSLMSKCLSLWKTFKIQAIAGDYRYNILHILHYRRKCVFLPVLQKKSYIGRSRFFFSPPHSLLWEWRIYFSICSTRLKEQSILKPFDASLNQTGCFLMLSPFF